MVSLICRPTSLRFIQNRRGKTKDEKIVINNEAYVIEIEEKKSRRWTGSMILEEYVNIKPITTEMFRESKRSIFDFMLDL